MMLYYLNVLVILLGGIVVAYDTNVLDLPELGNSCQKGIYSFSIAYGNIIFFGCKLIMDHQGQK